MKWRCGPINGAEFQADSVVLDKDGAPMIYHIQLEWSGGDEDEDEDGISDSYMTGCYEANIDGLVIHTGTMLECVRTCNELEAELRTGDAPIFDGGFDGGKERQS